MKNKNLIFSFLTVVTLTIGAGCLWTSCDDWTETEQVDYGVTTPDGQNPELYARYTQAVRNYKSRKHYAVCVRFDNGHSGDGEKDFLRSMPDSIDAVILENAATLNSADLEDIPVLQTNFATKVLFSFNLTSIKENAESSGQEIKTLLAPALEQMVSARPPKTKDDNFTRPKRAVEVEAALKEVTGSEVHVDYKDGKGSLKIDFYSDDMLQKFVSLLGMYDPEG